MEEYKISDTLACRMIITDGIHDAKKLIDLTKEAWKLFKDGSYRLPYRVYPETVPTPSVLASLPGAEEVFPEIKNVMKNKKGKILTVSQSVSVILSRFKFYLIRPCEVCGKNRCAVPSYWNEFSIFFNPKADLSHYEKIRPIPEIFSEHRLRFSPKNPEKYRDEINGCLYLDYKYPLDEEWSISTFQREKIPICKECEPSLVLEGLKRGIAEKKEQEAQNSLHREEQKKIEDEKQQLEKDNPAYLVVSHPSSDPDGFSRRCSRKISLGYRAWGGMQIDPQGNFVQAFQRRKNSETPKTKSSQYSIDEILDDYIERLLK